MKETWPSRRRPAGGGWIDLRDFSPQIGVAEQVQIKGNAKSIVKSVSIIMPKYKLHPRERATPLAQLVLLLMELNSTLRSPNFSVLKEWRANSSLYLCVPLSAVQCGARVAYSGHTG